MAMFVTPSRGGGSGLESLVLPPEGATSAAEQFLAAGTLAMLATRFSEATDPLAAVAQLGDPDAQRAVADQLAFLPDGEGILTLAERVRLGYLRESVAAGSGALAVSSLLPGEIVTLDYKESLRRYRPQVRIVRCYPRGISERDMRAEAEVVILKVSASPLIDARKRYIFLQPHESPIVLGSMQAGDRDPLRSILHKGRPSAWSPTMWYSSGHWRTDPIYTDPNCDLDQIYYGTTNKFPLFAKTQS